MSSERQISLSAAIALWVALALLAAFYGTWLGYGGRAFAITLAVFTFFLAVEILVAARDVQERMAGLLGTRGGPRDRSQ